MATTKKARKRRAKPGARGLGLPTARHEHNARSGYRAAEGLGAEAQSAASRMHCARAMQRFGMALKNLGEADAHDGSMDKATTPAHIDARFAAVDAIQDAEAVIENKCLRNRRG